MKRFLLTLLLISTLILVACQYLALPIILLSGPVKVQAAYSPKDRTTVVFVDDPKNLLPSGRAGDLIAGKIVADLKEQAVIKTFIEPHEMNEMRLETKDFDEWAVDRVGKRLNAEQVIYVRIDTFDILGGAGQLNQPIAMAQVRMVESQTGKRLFPDSKGRGMPVPVKLLSRDPDRTVDRSSQLILAEKLANRLGEEIGRLFYTYEQREIGSGLTPKE